MSISTLGESAIITSAIIKSDSVVNDTIQRINRDAVMKLDGLKADYFDNLLDRSDLKSALRSLFSDKRCKGFRQTEDLANLLKLVDDDIITTGTKVVKINDIAALNPRRYSVLEQLGGNLITVLVDEVKKPEGSLSHKSTYISEELFDNLTSVFGDIINQHVKRATKDEFNALEKAIAQRKSVFKRVLGFATSLLFRQEGTNGKDQLNTHVREFNFDLILETFKMNLGAVLKVDKLFLDKKVVVIDPIKREIRRHVTLIKKSERGWEATEFLISPRGMASSSVGLTITDQMMVFEPNTAFEIEAKARETLKFATDSFVKRLSWSIRHRY